MIDVAITLLVVAGAAAFLVWNLVARERKPACHTVAGETPAQPAPDVVLGASLSRGLERARKNRPSSSSSME